MITSRSIAEYQGAFLSKEAGCLYAAPSILLRSYISHYCFSFPNPDAMSEGYTVLPSANAVLVLFVKNGNISAYYNGTNAKASVVGALANTNDLLLLIKFQTGGFFPFYGFGQDECTDMSVDLDCIDKTLAFEIKAGLTQTNSIENLIRALDAIFLKRLKSGNRFLNAALGKIIARNGSISVRELSTDFCYSEKHIRRLFLQRVGVSAKAFARIVRVNHALHLLENGGLSFADIALKAGFYDQAHFNHDFKAICDTTPGAYLQNMSDFYKYSFEI